MGKIGGIIMKRETSVLIDIIVGLFFLALLWFIVPYIVYSFIQDDDGTLDITGIWFICSFILFWTIALFKSVSIVSHYVNRDMMIKGTPGSGRKYPICSVVTRELLEKSGFKRSDGFRHTNNDVYFLKHKEDSGTYILIWSEIGKDPQSITRLTIHRSIKENPDFDDIIELANIQIKREFLLVDLLNIFHILGIKLVYKEGKLQ